jgi:hypothetical protein
LKTKHRPKGKNRIVKGKTLLFGSIAASYSTSFGVKNIAIRAEVLGS